MKFRVAYVLAVLLVLLFQPLHAATPSEVEDRTREIATELRCVVCQNLSVADSPSEMAQQMRAIVREQVAAGKSTEAIKEFFVSKYGEWVLLKPKTSGVSALLWYLPYAALLIGIAAALWLVRRWSSRPKPAAEASSTPEVATQQAQTLREEFTRPDIEDPSARAQLLRERGRIHDELAELEFDFQAGKLSESDYQNLKSESEARGVALLQRIDSLPKEAKPTAKEKPKAADPAARYRFKRWQIISGGVFLMIFGIALGVMLTKSVRPRAGEGDSMTGDFMTGTSSTNADVRAALAEGKQAFGHNEFPKAIEAFKKVLAAEPNNPEAHSYMGFILVQAGHGDGALMAFDKALTQAPNLPMALWGKAMTLYRDKKDFAAAREILEKLLNMVPPGEERNEIAKVLAEIPAAGGTVRPAPAPAQAPAGATISGTITVDAKLKATIDPNAALFIIARPAGGPGGPPLAVKKIDKPIFPLTYSLSQDNVMMQGTPFTGKINITARLDKDGNPTTRGAGDLTGEYKKNPAEVGAKNVDILLDQAIQ